MSQVVFVVPFAMPSSLRFVRAVARLRGARVGLISQDPIERIAPDVRQQLAGFEQVEDAMDRDQLETAVRALGDTLRSVDVLLGILEPLQEPLAEVRERLGVRGMALSAARNFRDKARMKEVLAAAGLPCARHRLCASAAEAVAGLQRTMRNARCSRFA